MWNNLRKMFDGEIGQMYSTLRTSGSLISFDETETRFENHQVKWSENIFNEDSYQKYVKVLMETGDNYLEMLQGSKAEQRKWWLYNRFRYFDSKYLAGDAKSDIFQFRAYGKADVTITPYADIYATVSYANAAGAVVSVRAKRGQSYTLPNPLPASASDQETYIYSASQLKSVGDLSPFKPDTVKAANAVKLQELKIGDASPSYENPNLRELTLGKNILLKTLDVRNCVNLSIPINIKNCTNIEEVYFDNTQITNLMLPPAGILKVLHLPETITNLTLKNQPALYELEIAGTQNVQTLCIENIPSELIDAKSIIMQMPQGAEVRLIGFNMNVEGAEEIYDFYRLLDTMSGLNAQEETVEAAQISGNIYIDTILYSDYIALKNWKKNGKLVYQDVNIIAERIICKVNFYQDEEKTVLFSTQNIIQGRDAENPGIPTKESTEQYYYTFNKWDTDYTNVQKDLEIAPIYDEHIQVYEVKFDTQSTLVYVDSQFVEYGKKAVKPIDPYIPGATFLGWFNEPNALTEFDFNQIITGPTTAYAKWRDDNVPSVELERLTYNKFKLKLTDNIAVVKYAITTTEEEPTSWIDIAPTAEYIGEYEISNIGTYYVWARDLANLTGMNYISAYSISKDASVGTQINLYENSTLLTNSYALQSTPITYKVALDEHYENLKNYCNDEEIEDGNITEITVNTIYKTTCTPKIYTVKFNIGKYGEEIEDQHIVYLHKVEEPQNKYVEGKIIEGWYREAEFTNLWNFALDVVTNDMTLYANWIDYQEPSIITIYGSGEITANYYQSIGAGVEIDWGDGSPIESEKVLYNMVHLTHTYTEEKEYVIKMWCKKGLHYLGAGKGLPVISPSSVIRNVEFAWNMATTSAYALEKAIHLTTLNVPRYMLTLATGLCEGCSSLVNINLPNNLKYISSQAFKDCTGLTGKFKVPVTVIGIEDDAFNGCSNITSFDIHDDITYIGDGAFSNCKGLTEFTVPKGITVLSSRLLQGCSSLTYLDIPKYITEVEDNAFNGCTSLEKLIYRNKDLLIGSYTINKCDKLVSAGSINDEEHNSYSIEFSWDTEIPAHAFETGNNGSKLKEVHLPNTIKKIGASAFAFCQSIKTIELPVGLEIIDDSAFFWCDTLNISELPETVKSIGTLAFYRCYSLTSMSIPSTVETIGDNAFIWCFALRTVNLYNTSSINKINTPTLSWFSNCSATTVLHIQRSVIDPIAAFGSCWNYYTDTKTLMYYADL